jgi:hypothetical protein
MLAESSTGGRCVQAVETLAAQKNPARQIEWLASRLYCACRHSIQCALCLCPFPGDPSSSGVYLNGCGRIVIDLGDQFE